MIIAVNIRIKIRLKVKRANGMVNAVNTTLNCTPESLKSINVGDTANVLFSAMLDNLMPIAKLFNFVIAGKFIGINNRLIIFSDLRFNHRE